MNNFQKKYISKSILNNANSFSSFLKEGKHKEEMKKLLGLGMDIAMGLSLSREEERDVQTKQKELQIRSLRQSAAIRAMADRQRAQAAQNLARSRSAYYDAKAAEASFRASQIEQEVNKDEINARREAQDASIPNINPPSRGRGREAISQIAQPVVPVVKDIPDPTALEVLGSRLPGGESNVSRVFPSNLPLWTSAGVDPNASGSTNIPSEIPQPTTSTVETRQRKMKAASGRKPKNKNNGKGSASVETSAPVETPVPVEPASGPPLGKAVKGNMGKFATIMGSNNPPNKPKKQKISKSKPAPIVDGDKTKNQGPEDRLPKHQKRANKIKRQNLRKMRKNKTNESVSYLLNYILKG